MSSIRLRIFFMSIMDMPLNFQCFHFQNVPKKTLKTTPHHFQKMGSNRKHFLKKHFLKPNQTCFKFLKMKKKNTPTKHHLTINFDFGLNIFFHISSIFLFQFQLLFQMAYHPLSTPS